MTSESSTADPAGLQEAQERAVGISVFVHPNAPRFTCTLKHRYTDFLVNEVLPSGDVLHLTEISPEPERKRKREDDGNGTRKKQRPVAEEQSKVDANGETQSNGPTPSDPVVLPAADAVTKSDDSLQALKDGAIASISDEDKAILSGVFADETASAILNLYASVVACPYRKPRDHATIKSLPFAEKSKRTEAHMCIRRIFNSKLETITIQDPDQASSIISIKAAPPKMPANPNGESRNRDGQRGKQDWSELGGEYLHFTLYKENKDTMEVLYFLASQLKMHIKHFSFAGTKDRRAVTVQRVAVHRIKRDRVEHLNRLANRWRLGGPWEYKPAGLELGMLQGNQFLLTLRDARFGGEEADWSMERRLQYAIQHTEAATKAMHAAGFLNYYGLQRFGTYTNGTHVVGMRILKGDLKGAVDAILTYDAAMIEDNEVDAEREEKKVPYDDLARARGINAFVKSGTSNDALSKIPSRFTAERSLITHLGKRDRKAGTRPHENDFQGALMSIQKNLRMMYVHAYQSFVWNTVAGKRWELFGKDVVEGDLVIVGEKSPGAGAESSLASKQEIDEDGEPIFHPSASVAATKGSDGTVAGTPGGISDDPFVRARCLSKAEAESGQFSIFDLVLPLPGYDVIYPANALGKFYEDFMASESGGSLDPHNMRRAWKDISLSGGYRKMMARPLGSGVEVDIKPYSAPAEQMVETDLEKLEKGEVAEINDADGAVEKDKIAIVLKMQLGTSQYATMALRELTKGGAVGYIPDFSAANR